MSVLIYVKRSFPKWFTVVTATLTWFPIDVLGRFARGPIAENAFSTTTEGVLAMSTKRRYVRMSCALTGALRV